MTGVDRDELVHVVAREEERLVDDQAFGLSLNAMESSASSTAVMMRFDPLVAWSASNSYCDHAIGTARSPAHSAHAARRARKDSTQRDHCGSIRPGRAPGAAR